MADETRTIDPPPVINGSSFCTRKTGPRAMRLNALSKCSGVMVSIEACSVKPAFDTMMSTTPFSSLTAAATRSRSSRFAASALSSGDVASDQSGGLVELGLPAAEDKDVSAFGDKPLGGG
jgi:hypothetical protein